MMTQFLKNIIRKPNNNRTYSLKANFCVISFISSRFYKQERTVILCATIFFQALPPFKSTYVLPRRRPLFCPGERVLRAPNDLSVSTIVNGTPFTYLQCAFTSFTDPKKSCRIFLLRKGPPENFYPKKSPNH